ncbi:MAG: membrane dipeptidase [Proteobacteria bacterium]|nr:membrane dipeptidase [Pseudomonadota bacterium]MDA0951262.1 membrane dipeptidase [Pseudomonadota bacterium]
MAQLEPAAAALHRDALVWDDHGGWAWSGADKLEQLERWRASGIDYLSINAGFDVMPWELTLEATSRYRHWIRTHPEHYLQVETVADIHRARAEGKLALSFDLEGMNALNGDLGMVDLYYRLGVRHMLFAYNRNNAAGGGCHDEDVGLTPFGREVIAEMNRVGMVVDCSHCSWRTSMEAMERSAAPVIYSHANARALWDHERNIRDDQIKACAATGGVVGVTGVGRFLGPDGPTVAHLVEHIDYMVDLIGPDHVGFGMDSVLHVHKPGGGFTRNRDYWPESQYPDGGSGYVRPEDLPHLTQALLDRGYGEAAIRGILGGNFLRIAEQVWK